MFKRLALAAMIGLVSGAAAAGSNYTVNWSPESVAVPLLSTPFLVALATLVAVVVFRILRTRPAAVRLGAVTLTSLAGAALIAGSAELRAGKVFPGVPECTGSLPVGSDCGQPFGNACGSPIVVSYSDIDPDNCGALEDGLPDGSVLQNGDSDLLPQCSLAICLDFENNPQDLGPG